MTRLTREIGCWIVALAVGGVAAGCGDRETRDATRSAMEGPAGAAGGSHARAEPIATTPPEIVAALAGFDPYTRTTRLVEVLQQLGPEDASGMEAALVDASLGLSAGEIELLTYFWAQHDPEAASRFATKRLPRGFQVPAMQIALETWARQDLAGAFEFVGVIWLGNHPYRDVAQLALVRGWFESGEDGLDEYIEGLGPSLEQQRALYARFRRQIRRDGSEAAMEWARDVPEDDVRFKRAVYRQLGSELAMSNPADGVRWCDEVCEGPYGKGVRALVTQRWADRDGLPAMLWAGSAPPGLERNRAVTSALRGWWRRDRASLKAWVEGLPEAGVPAWFEPAIEVYAATVATAAPTQAIDWALRIADDEARERSLVNVSRIWRREDEAAAEAWLVESPLSEDARDRVRNPQNYRRASPQTPPEAAGDDAAKDEAAGDDAAKDEAAGS